MAALLCVLQKEKDSIFKFNFAVIVSAFTPSPPHLVEKLKNLLVNKESIPTLHIWGLKDTLISNDKSKDLMQYFYPNALSLEHEGGHYVSKKFLFPSFISSILILDSSFINIQSNSKRFFCENGFK